MFAIWVEIQSTAPASKSGRSSAKLGVLRPGTLQEFVWAHETMTTMRHRASLVSRIAWG